MTKIGDVPPRIYGEVDSPDDIRVLSRRIRREMDGAATRERLAALEALSDELCALAEDPAWERNFRGRVAAVRRVAREENGLTRRHARDVARRHGWDAAGPCARIGVLAGVAAAVRRGARWLSGRPRGDRGVPLRSRLG